MTVNVGGFYDKPDNPHIDGDLLWHGENELTDTRPQLIQDFLPEVGCGLLSGQTGTFKTFVGFDIAHDVMAGTIRQEWLGHKIIRPGGVLLVALEGRNDVAIRIQGVINDRHVIPGQAPFAWMRNCPSLMTDEGAAFIVQKAAAMEQRLVDRFDMPLSMILIDTVIAGAQFFREGQEQDSAIGQALVNSLNLIASECGCFVLGIDHFGKNIETGTRGSSAKEAGADVVLATLAQRDGATGKTSNPRLVFRKLRSGANGVEYPFTPRVVDLGVDKNGFPMTTLVIDWITQPLPPIVSRQKLSAKQRNAVTALAELAIDSPLTPPAGLGLPHTVKAVQAETWKAELIRRNILDPGAKNPWARFSELTNSLVVRGAIGFRDDLVWLASPTTNYEPL